MAEELKQIDFRKQITTQFHLSKIQAISHEWGLTKTECLWHILSKGIVLEKEKIEKEKLKKSNT